MDETLRELLKQLRRSHAMFIEDWVHKADDVSPGNYSDELQHAIATQEALEFILDNE